MIYIDNGKTVKEHNTTSRTDKAISTLLEQIEDMIWSETLEGYQVIVTEKGVEE